MATGRKSSVCQTTMLTFLRLYVLAIGAWTYADGQQTTVYKSVGLGRYSFYGNVHLQEYRVPDTTESVDWSFGVQASQTGCPGRHIDIYIQHGSFPLISQNNETFPEHFYLTRTSLQQVTIKYNKSLPVTVTKFTISQPLAGVWYAAAFVREVQEKLSEKGLSSPCDYSLQVNFTVNTSANVPDIISDQRPQTVQLGVDETKNFRFLVGDHSFKLTLTLSNCTTGHKDNCVIDIRSRANGLPTTGKDTYHRQCNLSQSRQCSMGVSPVMVSSVNYISLHNSGVNDSQVVLTLATQDCQLDTSREATPLSNREVSRQSQADHMLTGTGCPAVQPLDRVVDKGYFHVVFRPPETGASMVSRPLRSIPAHNIVLGSQVSGQQSPQAKSETGQQRQAPKQAVFAKAAILDTQPEVLSFPVLQYQDVGGTLSLSARISKPALQASSQNFTVYICLHKGGIVFADRDSPCLSGVSLQLDSGHDHAVTYVPFPEPATWFLTLQVVCYNHSARPEDVQPCNGTIPVEYHLHLDPCVDESCGGHGTCNIYSSAIYTFSTCKCNAGWSGYGCTDGSKALPAGTQLLNTLLLTLSNIIFIPAACLAIYRGLYPEAFVYLFVTFFSTFYHACDMDQWSTYVYCMMPYNVLSFSDFYGSIMAFWVTIIALAELPQPYYSVAHMVAALCIGMGVTWQSHGLWTFLVPAVVAVCIVLLMWGRKCCSLGRLYPSKRRWPLLVVGILLTALGLIIYTFLETQDNYPYTHSVWHLCEGLTIPFVLPKKRTFIPSGDYTKVVHEEEEDSDHVNLIRADRLDLEL